MLKRTAITFGVLLICLTEVRADMDAEFYGYWPTGGGRLTIAPVAGPTATGGIDIEAETGHLVFGGSPTPFAFRIPDVRRPGSIVLGALGSVTLDGPTELDITVSAATGSEDVVAYVGGFLGTIPLGPCAPNEDCLAVVFPAAKECDLNDDGLCNALDIDALSSAIQSGDVNLGFDLNQDGVVDSDDRTYWIESINGTLAGDADLDGQVRFADFLALSDSFGGSGSWSQGDFDGDGNVNFPDFLILSTNFGLPKPSTEIPLGISVVPEPSSSISMVLFGLFACSIFARNRRGRKKCSW